MHMGRRDDLKKLREAAAAALSDPESRAEAGRMVVKAAGDAVIVGSMTMEGVEAVAKRSGLATRKGKVSKVKVAFALTHPAKTARTLATATAEEIAERRAGAAAGSDSGERQLLGTSGPSTPHRDEETAAMTTLPFAMNPGEHAVGQIKADGFFASKHSMSPTTAAQIHLTTERFVALEERGMMKKRLEVLAEWPWNQFTERVNSSVGDFLGAGRNMLSLFTKDDETIATGFRNSRDMETFRELVARAMIPHLN
jgi:hypothetical protein